MWTEANIAACHAPRPIGTPRRVALKVLLYMAHGKSAGGVLSSSDTAVPLPKLRAKEAGSESAQGRSHHARYDWPSGGCSFPGRQSGSPFLLAAAHSIAIQLIQNLSRLNAGRRSSWGVGDNVGIGVITRWGYDEF